MLSVALQSAYFASVVIQLISLAIIKHQRSRGMRAMGGCLLMMFKDPISMTAPISLPSILPFPFCLYVKHFQTRVDLATHWGRRSFFSDQEIGRNRVALLFFSSSFFFGFFVLFIFIFGCTIVYVLRDYVDGTIG